MHTDKIIPVKEARKKAGLTQRAMSEVLGIPLSTIEQWDRGVRKPTSWAEKLLLEKLEQISKDNASNESTQ